jgi:hypothetical protein
MVVMGGREQGAGGGRGDQRSLWRQSSAGKGGSCCVRAPFDALLACVIVPALLGEGGQRGGMEVRGVQRSLWRQSSAGKGGSCCVRAPFDFFSCLCHSSCVVWGGVGGEGGAGGRGGSTQSVAAVKHRERWFMLCACPIRFLACLCHSSCGV